MTPARRRFGWVTAAALLLHGWLPVILGAFLVAGHGGDRYPPGVPICTAAAASPRPSRGPECPVTHDPICLCAIFVGCPTPVSGPSLAPPPAIRNARLRLPTRPPVRSWPVALFEARAPPAFG